MASRFSHPARALWPLLLLTSACSDCSGDGGRGGHAGDAGTKDDGSAAPNLACDGVSYACDGTIAIPCRADAGEPVDCAKSEQVCNGYSGCADCTPGEASCKDGKATWCSAEGELLSFECDAVQGLTCSPDGCKGACSLSEVHDSYIGCDYYPTVTLNPVWSGFAFSIAVSNASDEPTQVTITRGDQIVKQEMVPAAELKTIALDWVPELKGGDVECATPPARGASRLVTDGAYRVRTDRPVTVYQFSPLEYELDPAPAECPVLSECSSSPETRCLSYSNDASMLLPATGLTGNYTTLSWPTQTDDQGNSDGSGFLAITATADGTQVEVLGRGKFVAGAGIDQNGRGTVTMNQGDVLQLIAGEGDVSGTRVRADKPVQIIGGQSCAYVPSVDVLNCDHIEEAIFPEDTLGNDYLVSPPIYADMETTVPSVLRVTAISEDTEVTFEPELRGTATLQAGEVLELELSGDQAKPVRIHGSRPILVGLYMQGQSAIPNAGSVGDPSMSIAVPTEQFRAEYLFTAPVTYAVNIADVIAKTGTSVRIDGALVGSDQFMPIGKSDYGVAHVMLDASSSVHTLKADQEVGLTVYGYGLYTSYMYPGGADLERITIPDIL